VDSCRLAVIAAFAAAVSACAQASEIRGRIMDQDGEAVAGAAIIVLRSVVADGFRDDQAAGGAVTNDRGEYRLARLAPGRYTVRAAGFHMSSEYLGDDAPTPPSQDNFEPVEYRRPAVLRRLAASGLRVEAKPGEETTVDVKELSEVPR
jgi:hypothetical protein